MGYHGTDSNRIASGGKLFDGHVLQAFQGQARNLSCRLRDMGGWKAVASELAAGGTAEEIARRLELSPSYAVED